MVEDGKMERLCKGLSLSDRNEKTRKTALDNINQLYKSSQLWRANTRGTANHYSLFFPEDNDLKLWRDMATEKI